MLTGQEVGNMGAGTRYLVAEATSYPVSRDFNAWGQRVGSLRTCLSRPIWVGQRIEAKGLQEVIAPNAVLTCEVACPLSQVKTALGRWTTNSSKEEFMTMNEINQDARHAAAEMFKSTAVFGVGPGLGQAVARRYAREGLHGRPRGPPPRAARPAG